jgi:hypothetical protein
MPVQNESAATSPAEACILAAYRTAHSFPLPRRNRPIGLSQLTYKPGALLGLRLVGHSERWLVAVYTEGAIGVWDLQALDNPTVSEELAKGKRAEFQLTAGDVQSNFRWTSFEAAFEPASVPGWRNRGEPIDEGCIYVVVNEALQVFLLFSFPDF